MVRECLSITNKLLVMNYVVKKSRGYLFSQKLPVPADHGCSAETSRIQERHDIESKEAG